MPDGSGEQIPGSFDDSILDDYVFMPGRDGGQVVNAILGDTDPTFGILSTNIGTVAQRWQAPSTVTVTDAVSNGTTTVTSASSGFSTVAVGALVLGDLVPDGTTVVTRPSAGTITVSNSIVAGTSTMTFSHITDLGYVTNGSARDILLKTSSNLQVISSSATAGGQASGIRFAVQTAIGSTVRSFLQAGPTNLNLALCGFNGVNGSSLHELFEYMALTTWDGTALTNLARVGINVDPFDYSGSTDANKPGSLFIKPVSTSLTNPAAVIVEQSADGQPLFQLRGASSADASPNRDVGTITLAMRSPLGSGTNNGNGSLLFYNSNTLTSVLTAGGTSSNTGTLTLRDASENNVAEFQPLTRWSTTVASTNVKLGATTANALITGGAYNVLNALGVSTQGMVVSNANSVTMILPAANTLFSTQNSSGVTLFKTMTTGATTIDLPATGSVALTLEHPSGTDDFLVCSTASVGNTATIDANGAFNLTSSAPLISWASSGVIGSGDFVAIDFADLTPASGGTTLRLPTVTGTTDMTFVFTAASQTLTTKTINSSTIGTSTELNSTNASTGVAFQDTGNNARQLRMILSGASANNHTFTLTNSAARNYGFGNLSGNVVIVGDDPPAVASGALGKVDLTAQTAGIGSTNLSSTPPAGVYAVEVYAACTTASGSGAPTLDVTIGWTDVVGATTANAVGLNGSTFPLPLSATGRAHARFVIQVASGDIAYSTTINAASGSPQYAIYIRVVQLG